LAIVDLRSDTFTMPSPAMRKAMDDAQLGDDVWGEDPTINRLQEVAAERLGKEAALFVSSGTMGNLLGVLVSARSGQEVIADAESHTFLSEVGGAAALGGIQIMPVKTEAGIMSPEQVVDAIRVEDVHHPRTAAIAFENTHNYHGGIAWPLAELRAASDAAHAGGLAVHLDGARLFNAAVATGTDPREIAACADTVTFCLSKGLGAPVGSVLLGPAEKIAEAKRWRKMLGGGMRQVGMLGAAGLFALDNMVDRLAEDHANARTLAEGLAEMDGVRIDLARVQTNLVIFELEQMAPADFVAESEKRGIKCAQISRRQVRFVTHFGISATDIQETLKVAGEVLAS
jgi:threonine aldolase